MEATEREVKTQLSQLLERVFLGEEITITRAGEPVARLVPAAKFPHRGRLGWGVGEFSVPDDFDAPLPADVEDGFYIVKYLLDTHAFLRAAFAPDKLSPPAEDARRATSG